MEAKVSIIIPVYNAEPYISECIDSLLQQTLAECEFIFINDGSTDKSKEKILHYLQSDPRIKWIDQDNQGVSAARNRGLSVANGEYIGFVDADDYIEKDMYEVLYRAAKEDDCDVVISNFESELEGHKVVTKYPFPIGKLLDSDYIEQEILLYFLKGDSLNTACSKLYKNRVIRAHHVKFPERVALGEDGLFNMQLFRHAAHVTYIDYTGYHYREVAGSATRNISAKDYFGRALEVYMLDIPDEYLGRIDKEKVRQLKSIKLITSVMSYIYVYFSVSNEELNFWKRFSYVKNMIKNPYVREAFPIYYYEMYRTLGRYEKVIVNMIRRKSTMGLYCATAYSRLRNRLPV